MPTSTPRADHRMTPSRAVSHVVWIAVFGALAITGCGPRDRYVVSGSVMFDGRPIPAGAITFIPFGDGKKGRTAGFCQFKDGKYSTQTGRNPGSGPHRVLIVGCDGVAYQTKMGEITEDHPLGKPLFPTHLVEIDVVEKDDNVFDFDVPKTR